MTKISTIDMTAFKPVLDQVLEKTSACRTLEEAAQLVTNILYEEFHDSIVLIRLYATVPFGKLPPFNRNFVTQLANTTQITHLLEEETPVLSLLGTRGLQPTWNDSHQSQGHVGIPLVSAAFIDTIPMMSRLLKEVGLNLAWIDKPDSEMITGTSLGLSGIFYVPDAKTAVDQWGRKIISAQDFVEANNVQTVFALAGGYLTSKTFMTLIVFCNESLKKPHANLFTPLIAIFKANTMALASTGAIFD